MAHTRADILNCAYKQYKPGIMLQTIIYHDIDGTPIEIQNTLNNLEDDGLIEICSPAIGMATIKLTEYGITSCGEKIFS